VAEQLLVLGCNDGQAGWRSSMRQISAPPRSAELFVHELFASADRSAVEQATSVVSWWELDAGDVLFRQGDETDSLFIVHSGLLRVVLNGSRIGEFGVGTVVGELGLLLGSVRTAGVVAVRRSVVASLPVHTAEFLAGSSPAAAMRLARLAATRRDEPQPFGPPRLIGLLGDEPSQVGMLSSRLAALSNARDARGFQIAESYGEALMAQIAAADSGGDPVLVPMHPGDESVGALIRQCDLLLVVVGSTAGRATPVSKEMRTVLAEIGGVNLSPVIDLVVCHRDSSVQPHGTRKVVDALGSAVEQVHHHDGTVNADAALARRLRGSQVGLVLSGGGARGMSHLGVAQALFEGGHTIDLVSGSSIGALIACLLAQLPHNSTADDVAELSARAATVVERLNLGRRITVPLVSMLSVRRVDATYTELLGDRDLLDSWRPCFVTTADLTSCELRVIRQGSSALWSRASASPPGLFPPVVDEDGHLHLDGALYDNLPVLPMRAFGASTVIAVNVSNRSPFAVARGGPQVSTATQWVRQKMRSGTSGSFPTIGRVLSRTAIAPSLAAQSDAIAAADWVIEPAVDSVGLGDYRRSKQMIGVGLEAGRAWVATEQVRGE
jgi:predicted acylesterase/phospholipase RssA